MKFAAIAIVSTLAVISLHSQASNNTYVYSNTEYCELADSNVKPTYLQAYSRKLGFTPTAKQCRVLLSTTIETVQSQPVSELKPQVISKSAQNAAR